MGAILTARRMRIAILPVMSVDMRIEGNFVGEASHGN